MVMPAAPVTDLVVCQARFALGASQAFFDAVFGLGGAGELGERSFGGRVREVVIRLRHGRLVAVPVADHDQHFVLGGFLAFVVAGADAAFQHLDDERSLRAVAHVDRGPGGRGLSLCPCRDALPRTLRRAADAGPTSRSRIDVLLGMANMYCSFNARKSWRNQLGRPISSSPVIH